MTFKTTGLDKLIKNLENMEKASKNLDGENDVPYEELFNLQFMKKYTSFNSINDFLVACGVESQEDFDALPEENMDKHVTETSSFSSWKEMLGKAAEEYFAKELGL